MATLPPIDNPSSRIESNEPYQTSNQHGVSGQDASREESGASVGEASDPGEFLSAYASQNSGSIGASSIVRQHGAQSSLSNLPPELKQVIAGFSFSETARGNLRGVEKSFQKAVNDTTHSYKLHEPADIEAALLTFTAAKKVTLEGGKFTDTDVRNFLHKLPPTINELALDGCYNLTAEVLVNLSPQIKSLSIEYCDGIATLKNMDLSHLESLELYGDDFEDRTLEGANLSNLKYLDLLGMGFGPQVLTGTDLIHLESLSLNGPKFGNEPLVAKNLETMTYLKLAGRRFGDRALANIDFKNLQTIVLNGKGFTNEALRSRDLRNMQRIYLGGAGFNNNVLADKSLSRLKSLALKNTMCDVELFKEQTQWPSLAEVSLSGSQFTSPEAMSALLDKFQSWGVLLHS